MDQLWLAFGNWDSRETQRFIQFIRQDGDILIHQVDQVDQSAGLIKCVSRKAQQVISIYQIYTSLTSLCGYHLSPKELGLIMECLKICPVQTISAREYGDLFDADARVEWLTLYRWEVLESILTMTLF